MKKSFLYTLPAASLALAPTVASAAQYFGEVDNLFTRATGFIDNILIPLLFTIALLVFLYGMYIYFIQGGASETDREKGRQLLLWSIIGFVLMVSIWGIVNMLSQGIFGNTTAPDIPGTPTVQRGGA